jgi:hypothetical protein
MIPAVRLAASSGRAPLDPPGKRGGFIPRSRAIKQRDRAQSSAVTRPHGVQRAGPGSPRFSTAAQPDPRIGLGSSMQPLPGMVAIPRIDRDPRLGCRCGPVMNAAQFCTARRSGACRLDIFDRSEPHLRLRRSGSTELFIARLFFPVAIRPLDRDALQRFSICSCCSMSRLLRHSSRPSMRSF